MTSKTRTSKAVEKAEETTVPVWEIPGYKALTEEEMRRDLSEADIYSRAFALIPYQMRGNAGDMYLLMQIAKHLNVPFITALRGLSFIGDKDVKPAMSAQLMSALVRNAGHTLREQWDPETNTATAVIIRKDDPQFEHVAVWDEEKARVAGLWESTPTWMQYPKAMLTARAMSEVCRHAASEVLLGFSYVPEEFQTQESASRVLDMRQQVQADMDRLHLSSEKAIEVLDGVTLPGIPVNLMTPRELEEVNARIGVIEYERDKDKIDEVRERIQRGRDVLGLTEGAFAEIVRRNVRPGRAYDTMNLREAEQVLDVLLRQAKKSGSRSGQRQPVQQTPAPQQQPAQQAPAPAPVQESYGLCDEAQRPQQYPPLGSQKPEGVSGRMAMIQRTMKEHGVPEGELPIILTYVFGDDERADVANVDSLSMADMPAVLEGIQRYAAETVSRPEPTAELPLDGNMDDLEASYNMQGSEVDDDPEETWSAPWPETAKPGGGAN
jgi:hypothetical protein